VRSLIGYALLVALFASGCPRKTDAQRAAEERAEAARKVERSLLLVPYRSVKTLFRARATATPPSELAPLYTALDATRALPGPSDESVRATAARYLDLGVALYEARAVLKTHDEDRYPLLFTAWAGVPPPLSWYDAPAEHLFLATLWLILDQTSGQSAVADAVFYELTRAPAQAGWPRYLRVSAQLLRGLSYCVAGFHYAAEEELTAYLGEVAQVPALELTAMRFLVQDPEAPRHELRALGDFSRAYNRMGLGRDDAAADDVEHGLVELQALGVDNELTQWGWAFVHYRRGRYPEAGLQLIKLAASPNLDARTRLEILESAKQLQAQKKDIPVLSRTRAAVLLSRALLARAGGLEHVLCVLLGDDLGKKLYTPLSWLDRLRSNLAPPTPTSALDKLKQKLP
jgi:hypothetical protein